MIPIYSKGDILIYPSCGLVEIKDRQKQKIDGSNVDFYFVQGIDKKTTMYVPVKSAAKVGLRRVTPEKQLDAIYATFKEPSQMEEMAWFERFKINEEKVKTGELKSYAEVIRDVHQIKGVDPISTKEKQQLTMVWTLLINEIAYITKKKKSDLRKEIEKLLRKRDDFI